MTGKGISARITLRDRETAITIGLIKPDLDAISEIVDICKQAVESGGKLNVKGTRELAEGTFLEFEVVDETLVY